MNEIGTTRAHLGMLIWALIVGASFPVVGFLGKGLPPLLLTAMRFAIAALAILPMAWGAGPAIPKLRSMLLYAIMGLCLAGFFSVMFWAAHRVSALSMSALFVSMPLLAYGIGRTLDVEPHAHRLPAILALGAVGALALALAQNGGELGGLQFGWGEGTFFLGCIASALYPVLSKWGLTRGIISPNAAVRTFWSLVLGGILIAIAGVIVEPVTSMSNMGLQDVLLVTYLGVFSSGVTFWLMQNATATLTPGAVTGYSYLVPFVSMLVLFITRPDVIGWQWLPGSLLVLTAITLLVRARPA